MAALAWLQVLLAGQVRADSDGYYCVGHGYLAYQLRGALTSNVRAHTLRVVRYGADGIHLAGEVVIEDFQPHRMVCTDEAVRIGGFSTRPVEYVIDVGLADVPQIDHVVSNPQLAAQRTEFRNLGAWAPNGTLELPDEDSSHDFFLVTSETEQRIGDEILHHKRTHIVMTDLDGNALQRLQLFNGHRIESID